MALTHPLVTHTDQRSKLCAPDIVSFLHVLQHRQTGATADRELCQQGGRELMLSHALWTSNLYRMPRVPTCPSLNGHLDEALAIAQVRCLPAGRGSQKYASYALRMHCHWIAPLQLPHHV